jgi:hypothetical protein
MLIQNRKQDEQNIGNKFITYDELNKALVYIEANFDNN